MEGQKTLEVIVLSPPGVFSPDAPLAAARAGSLGLLDLTLAPSQRVEPALARLTDRPSDRIGVLLDGLRPEIEEAALARATSLRCVVLAPPHSDPGAAVARWRGVVPEVGLVVASDVEGARARELGVDFVLARGHEAGGRVGADSTYVLLQKLLASDGPPVFAWGGIGLHSAAAAVAGGARGVVLDSQLALMEDSGAPGELKRRLAAMDGSETTAVPMPGAEFWFRGYDRPGLSACAALQALADRDATPEEWEAAIRTLAAEPTPDRRLLPVGQDAATASAFAECARTVGRAIRELERRVEASVRGAARARVLDRGGPLARSHGTDFPIVQGPMTHVSDVPSFCDAVGSAGALPFLALALMRQEVHELLAATRERMGRRPWGVGVLGFADPDTRREQIAAIESERPPFAIIAGGRPDQAAALERNGIVTYLHVPSPRLLEGFLAEGARRFVFEGRECGGHVGPRTSFALWDAAVGAILRAPLSPAETARVHVLFAGGIHDARSAAMVAALAQPLVDRGVSVGVLMGTAYLFTREIVETGALVEGFQRLAIETDRTAILETSPGHAIRCGANDYTHRFEAERTRLRRGGAQGKDLARTLEELNRGRLRVASKGIDRAPEAKGSAVPKHAVGYVPVEPGTQRREGMFMLGQVSTLRAAVTTVAALHEEVGPGSADLLERSAGRMTPSPGPRPEPPAPLDVAIVGMSCLLPDANDVHAFWDNILARHDAVREIPPDRFDVASYFDPDRSAPDRIYSRWGGFLRDVPFDPIRYGIPPAAVPSIEPVQLLALVLVDQVLRDAGYALANPYRERTSVILGAGGGMGELASGYTTRSSLPQYLRNPEDGVYGLLPEWTEDSFAGILLNVIAGRASNRFDLGGLNFTVDAACASALAAVYIGCRELAEGTSDMVIAGGVDTVQNPTGYMCFSKTQALSPRGRSRAFDAGADGIVISEGLACVMLKRREDAERDGDRIHALLRGAAGGSDGRQKSLTAPCVSGQLRTLKRAYAQARFDPASVVLFEGHGTGTGLGDPTESQALGELLREAGAPPGSVALGSVKSMIGHTKAAAGVAGLVKAALSIEAGVLPATLHVETPNPRGDLVDGPLYLNTETRPWVRAGGPRRAAVSSFGFGGTNFHVVLEEYEGRVGAPRNPRRTRPSELFAFSASEAGALVRQIREFHDLVLGARDKGAELALCDLAYTLHCRPVPASGSLRAAVVASRPDELLERLVALARRVEGGPAVEGVYFEEAPLARDASVAFLFPGQGSQYVGMIRDLALEFAEVRDGLERADLALRGCHEHALSRYLYPPPAVDPEARGRDAARLKATDVAQPALGACEAALVRLLESFGVRPGAAAGHSYGELAALHAAGCLDEERLLRLSWERARSMLGAANGNGHRDLGGMLSVQGDEEAVRRVLGDVDEVWIANLNGPRQTAISGTRAGLARAEAKCAAGGLTASRLAVSCGFHSPLMQPARDRFAAVLDDSVLGRPAIPVYCNSTAGRFPDDSAGIRRLLATNLVERVLFADEIEAMYRDGARVFVEVGPHNVLSRLVGQVLGGRPHAALPLDVRGREGLTQLHHVLASLLAQGADVDLERLYSDRPLRVLDLAALRETPHPEIGRHTWLVNGAYARLASEKPRVLSPERRAAIGSTAPAPAPAPPTVLPEQAPGPPPVPAGGDFGQFQETMRAFLRTQEAVLTAYLANGTRVAPVAPGARRAAAGGLREATPLPPAAVAALREAPVPGTPSAAPPTVVAPAPRDSRLGSTDGNGGGTTDLEALLRGIVSERTGYPPEVLALDSDLEADLSIDSIKRVEIVAAVRRKALPGLEKPPEWFMEEMTGARSLSAILAGLRRLAEREGGAPAATGPAERGANGRSTEAAGEGAHGGNGRGHDGRGAPIDLEALLRGIVSERTGYPPEVLALDSDLEADLSIDSIKRVEIVAAVRRKALPGLEKPPEWFMEEMTGARSLSAILAGLRRLVENGSHPAGSAGPTPPPPSGDLGTKVVAPPALPLEDGMTATGTAVRCVVEPQSAPLPRMPRGWRPDGLVLVTDDGHGVSDDLARALEDAGGGAVRLPPGALLTRESATAAVAEIRRRGRLGALVHLAPLGDAPRFPGIDVPALREHVDREVRGLLLLLQALAPELSGDGGFRVLAASRGGGDFERGGESEGHHPWRGGLAGLLKTAAREWEHAHFRAVDFDTLPDAGRLLAELAAPGPVEIGWRDGDRLSVHAVRRDLEHHGQNGGPGIDTSDVVLATGGARGITAQVLRAMAEAAPATFVLLGRSPVPDAEEDPATARARDAFSLRATLVEQLGRAGRPANPRDVEGSVRSILAAREIRHTLAELGRLGARVEYRTCDVTDGPALERVVSDVRERHGRISVVVHGAGAIEDRLIPEKSAESFDRVVRTKLEPILTLERVLEADRPRAVMLFSSVAGFYGNPGQADYAAANEALNRMARRLRELVPGRVVALNWGPWGGTGMVTPEVARQFAERGIGLVDPLDGSRAARLELREPAGRPVRVVIGSGPWASDGNGAHRPPVRPPTPPSREEAPPPPPGGAAR